MKNINHATTGICGLQSKERDYQRTAKRASFLLEKITQKMKKQENGKEETK